MGLLSGLDKLGFGDLSDLNVYDEKKDDKHEELEETKEAAEIHEADFLFDKTYSCPVCYKDFHDKTIRTGKVRLLSVDTDLRPRYQEVDCVKYDCVVCENCGYAALTRYITSGLTSVQRKSIMEKLTPNFTGIDYDNDYYTYEDAITRYQLVLLNTVVKGAKNSEKAYTCLKLSWLTRGMIESLDEDDQTYLWKKKQLKEQEEQYTKKAYEGFTKALKEEMMPICGMDEDTFMYLLAELARRCKDYSNSAKLVSEVLVSRTANHKVKDRARELKEMLIEEMKHI